MHCRFSKEEIVEKLLEVKEWFHAYEIVPGIVTPGRHDYDPARILDEYFEIPGDLSGETVLEIGAWDGALTFELERRGAEVTAIDIQDPDETGFNISKEILGARARYVRGSVYDAADLVDGNFDRVLMPGVLYHLKHPLLALEAAAGVLGEPGTLYLEGECWHHYAETPAGQAVKTGEDGASFFSNLPAALCYPGRFKKGINWFVPNRACLESWARASGLEIQDFKMVKDHYPDQRYACRLVKTRTAEEEHPVYARSGTLENPCVIERRARLCRETGDREQARSLYARGMEILREKREKTPLDIYRLGSFQQNVGQYPEAIVSFESLIDSAGVEPTLQAGAHFHLGEIHAACGERSRAKKYFLRCLEINPGHKKARERYQSL